MYLKQIFFPLPESSKFFNNDENPIFKFSKYIIPSLKYYHRHQSRHHHHPRDLFKL